MTEPAQLQPRRLYPGAKLEDIHQYPFIPLNDLESAFGLQEYLQSLVAKGRDNVESVVELPEGQDADVWQLEQLRQLCLELNQIVVQLEPECNQETCPEMKAEEWLYLCAAHTAPQSCCAIDYIVHTLDGATALLSSSRFFPSRISVPEPSLKHYQSIARRLYRIFAHAWFHHREVFESFENETSLYRRFLRLSEEYKLIPKQLIIIPDPNGNTGEYERDTGGVGTRRSSTGSIVNTEEGF